MKGGGNYQGDQGLVALVARLIRGFGGSGEGFAGLICSW